MGRGGNRKISGVKMDLFLDAFARTGIVAEACRHAGLSRNAVYQRRKHDPEFADKWAEAEEDAADALEAEARRRAVEGTEEPVFHRGEICGHIRKYSDALLLALLKATRPDKFDRRFADPAADMNWLDKLRALVEPQSKND